MGKRKSKQSAPAPAPSSAPEPKRRKGVSLEALGMSRLSNSTTGPTNVFAAARPAPGVVPDGVKPMAMDEDLGAWTQGLSQYSENFMWLGMPYLAELAQRSEYRQIVETIAKEMTRRWIKVTAKGDDDKTERVKAIEDALKKYKIREKFRRLAELDGFFGRGHLYVDTGYTEDRDILKIPLILDKRTFEPGTLRDFRIVEPTWTYPGVYNSMDPLAEDFYAPRTWYVFGKEIHRTRLITMISREVPDLLKPSYQFGGVSMSQLARPYVENWLRTRQAVSDLVHSFSTMILKTDMSDILQDGGSQTLFDRITLYNNVRDNRGLMALDKDHEDLTNVSTPLGALDALQAQAQEQMASVSHTPLIVLLGITPSGLNATGEDELQMWESWVRSMQEHLFDEPLERVIKYIQIDKWGEIDPDIGFDYEPLRELTDAEQAEARKQEADTHAIYVNAGVIAPEEVRQALAEDEGSPYAGVDLSGPPPEPPQMELDPLGGAGGGPPDAPGGAPPASATRASYAMGDDAPRSPDLVAGIADAIRARQDEMAYEHWWHGAQDAFEEGKHPRGQPENAGEFVKGQVDEAKQQFADKGRKALKSIADVSLPPDTDKYEYFYHSTRYPSDIDEILKNGIQPKVSNGKVFLSKNEIRDRGNGGFVIVRVPKGQTKKGIDRVEPGLEYEEHTASSIPLKDVLRVVRHIPTGGGHTIREDQLAKYADENPGLRDADVKTLPTEYQKWFVK